MRLAHTLILTGLLSLSLNATAQGTGLPQVSSVEIKGSVVADGTTLPYCGNGLWRGEVSLDVPKEGQYIGRYVYFTINGNDSLTLRRKPRTDSLVYEPGGKKGENIRVNNGTYTVTVDLNSSTFRFDAPVDPWRISVFGSSVANGQGAPGFKGYAYNYGNLLRKRSHEGAARHPFYTSGVSIGGNTTRHLLNRYDDLLRDFGRYVVFGLSLGNEGIHGAENPEEIFNQFRDNMLTLIAKVRADGKIPVIVNNYPRGDYDASDYACVKQMNLLIHQWDLPSVNVLGAIDDGTGKWAENYIEDVAHPNLDGHMEFLYAFVPSLFDAIEDGKALPTRETGHSLTLEDGQCLAFKGEETVHPFTLSARVKTNEGGRLFTISLADGEGYVSVSGDGSVSYSSPAGTAASGVAVLSDDEWHDVTLSHYHALGKTYLYVDDRLAGTVDERIAPGEIRIGDAGSKNPLNVSEVAFWRSGLNAEEVAAWHNGAMLKSSLEIYAPMQQEADGTIANRAQSLNSLTLLSNR